MPFPTSGLANVAEALPVARVTESPEMTPDKVPAFVIFHDSTLEHLCARKPATMQQLRAVPGIGETKLERYGRELLEVLCED